MLFSFFLVKLWLYSRNITTFFPLSYDFILVILQLFFPLSYDFILVILQLFFP